MTPVAGILNQPIAQRLGWALLHSLWQGALVAALFGLLRAGLRRASAHQRYLAGCGALAVLAALPVATLVCNWTPMPEGGATAGLFLSGVYHGVPGPATGPLPGSVLGIPTFSSFQSILDLLGRLAPSLAGAWLLGVVVLSLRLGRGCCWVRRIRSQAGDLPDTDLIERLNDLRLRLGISRPVRLLRSALVEVPAVVGWLRPVILLPAATMAGLDPAQLEAILAHELAHIRRFDYLVNACQCAVEILMFYHPAVWWISRCVRDERENCCDDLVVAVCEDRLTYARALATLEKSRAELPELAFAASGGPLLQRIRRLLGAADPQGPVRPRHVTGLVLIGLGLILITTGIYLLLGHTTYQAVACLKLESGRADVPRSAEHQPMSSYDPYFIQTEFEVIQSEAVLSKVIEALNLNLEWGRKYAGGESLKTSETVTLLKLRMDLRPLGGTSLVEIRFRSDNRDEAARIANGIANAYRDYRSESWKETSRAALGSLEAHLKEEEQKVREAQEYVDDLRAKLQIPDSMIDADAPTLSISGETLRNIEGMRLEYQARVMEQETLCNKLRSLSDKLGPMKVAEVIPTAVQDPLLQTLLEQLSLNEQNLVGAQAEYGAEHPQVTKAKALVADLSQRISSRVDGIFIGLEAKVASMKVGLKTLEEQVAEARTKDLNNSSATQPYFKAKRELEERQRFRQVLYMKLASERIDGALPKAAPSVVDQADPPALPISPNQPRATAMVFLGLLFEIAGALMLKTGPTAKPNLALA
jgi:uncharacterized protein involved in exopolysaccharide biosynthesis/beta-lactamase regulating signal transducer with metallopeptidase domain